MAADAPEFFLGKRLIVFGAGYLGAEMVRQGVARGLEVHALTRNALTAERLAALGAAVVRADLASSDWHERLPSDAEFVVDCVSSGGGGLAGYQHSYVAGLRSLLAWRARLPAGVGNTFIYTGSTSVYPQDGGVRVDETAPTGAAGETVQALLDAETLAGAWPGPRYVLRLAGVYGPERHHLLDQLRAGAGALAGRGDHRLNLAHRDDIVAALWAVFALQASAAAPAPASWDSSAATVFNVADEGAATKAEVVRWLAERLGCAMPVFTGEPVAGRRLHIPDRLIANDRLKRATGWRPRYPTFREGYAALLAHVSG